jgi:hypothetical protein
VLGADVDLAGHDHDAQLAVARLPLGDRAGGEREDLEADVAPARRLRGHAEDGAVGAGGR